MTSEQEQPPASPPLDPDEREPAVTSEPDVASTPEPEPEPAVPADAPDEADKADAPDAPGPVFEESGEEAEAAPEAEPPEEPRSSRSMLVGLSLLAVVLVGILVLVLVTGGGDDSGPSASPAAATTTVAPAAPGPTLPAEAFTTFHDDLTGFTIRFPTAWQRAQSPVSEIRLVVSTGEGEGVSVRVNNTEQATTPDNLGNLKTVTDGTIASNPTARVVKTAPITLNGLIGYYYLYTFKDDASGLEGAHAHYFLFKGNRMYSIVFQALPVDKFTAYSGVFDQIAESFKVDP